MNALITFPAQPKLSPVEGLKRNFVLLEDFICFIDGRKFIIPAGFVWDGASIPSVLEPVINNDDPRIFRPSIIHDFGYATHGQFGFSSDLDREQVDQLLMDGMEACGASFPMRLACYIAVRSAGWIWWKRNVKPEPLTVTAADSLFKAGFYREAAEGPRSARWAAVRRAHLQLEPWCRYCGGITDLEVHHVKPFRTNPELELVGSNLITLCEDPVKRCHLMQGHLGNWFDINPDIRSIARQPRPQTH
jgi:Protein of unknown function (DUF1353)/HNH endonuclease